MLDNIIKYLIADSRDDQFGLTVTTIGHQNISSGAQYPPVIHPQDYYFKPVAGRILHEYQLLYITSGRGVLSIESIGDFVIESGCMFLLFPGVRHRYAPDTSTGWNEYWIGFKGSFVESIVSNGFFAIESPVLTVGYNERIIDLYMRGMEIAAEGRAGYQQALSGIAMHMLGLASYRNRTSKFDNTEVLQRMNHVKLMMRERVYEKLDIEEFAQTFNMSYSSFRKTFKDVIGVSPSYYFQELKLDEAKRLLSTSDISVKEIAAKLNYDNPESFSVFFKKRTGFTASEYRQMR